MSGTAAIPASMYPSASPPEPTPMYLSAPAATPAKPAQPAPAVQPPGPDQTAPASRAMAAMYPSASDGIDAGAEPEPSQGTAPTTPEIPAPTVIPAEREMFAAETALPLETVVDFAEAPLKPGDPAFPVPNMGEHIDRSPAGEAERSQLAGTMMGLGIGRSLATEAYQQAERAARPGYQAPSREAAMTELRQAWGGSFDRNLAAARGLIARAAASNPQVVAHLNRTGLGNDPRFIRLAAAAAHRMMARGARRT